MGCRPWEAMSAASDSDTAEGFFFVLNENLALGWTAARVSANFSCNALIAYEEHKSISMVRI